MRRLLGRGKNGRVVTAGRGAFALKISKHDGVAGAFDAMTPYLRRTATPHLVVSLPISPGQTLMERARGDLLAVPVKSDAAARRVLFQALWTVAALQARLGRGARHNDTGLANWLVRRRACGARAYETAGRRWVLPRGRDVCLADWDFLHAPRRGLVNSRVVGGRYGIRARVNQTYDARLLLISFQRRADLDRLPETRRWLASLGLGTRARVEDSSPRRLSPKKLLKSKFFDAFLNETKKAKTYRI